MISSDRTVESMLYIAIVSVICWMLIGLSIGWPVPMTVSSEVMSKPT